MTGKPTPTPQSGGSYEHDAKTGKAKRLSGTAPAPHERKNAPSETKKETGK